MKKICIITARHISYNPRVLKEADCFFNEGYDVTVVTINNHNVQSGFDEEIMKTRKWKLKTTNFRRINSVEKRTWIYFSLYQKFYSLLSRWSYKYGIAEKAILKGYPGLLKLALNEKADFYIVHHAEALSLGYQAAKKHHVPFGFDAEDFQTGMNEGKAIPAKELLVGFVEKKYLPKCSYFTSASKGIGEEYQKKYGLKEGATILNVFSQIPVEVKFVNSPVRFYWYSQVIGPNRSLETLLLAASQVQKSFEIHLRGSFHSEDYRTLLTNLITQYNLTAKVFIHPPILSEEIIKEATRYDIGLALESDVSLNRNICVTNKIFSYLMSGLAIIGTDTDGQKDIFTHFKEAVLICRMNDAEDLAQKMLYYINYPNALLAARRAAVKAAEKRFNWEIESQKLIENFKEATMGVSLDTESRKAILI